MAFIVSRRFRGKPDFPFSSPVDAFSLEVTWVFQVPRLSKWFYVPASSFHMNGMNRNYNGFFLEEIWEIEKLFAPSRDSNREPPGILQGHNPTGPVLLPNKKQR